MTPERHTELSALLAEQIARRKAARNRVKAEWAAVGLRWPQDARGEGPSWLETKALIRNDT